ncbi:MAG: sialidase, partial [Cyanobacteria bacterium M5B4]
GSDGAVYQIYWDGSRWSGWIRQNMIIASAPAAVVGPQGTAVFARSIDNQLQRLG